MFRTGVELVELDVSVYDNHNEPARGLTAGDFALTEDRRPTKIETFSEVEDDSRETPPSRLRDAPIDVASSLGSTNGVYALVVDDASLSFFRHSGVGVARARSISTEVINRLSPSDLAAVVFTGDNHRSQDFTSDHGRLLAAVSDIGAPAMSDCAAVLYGVSVLQRVVDAISELPGRKAVIDITASPLNKSMLHYDPQGCAAQAFDLNDRLLAAAQYAHVNIYTIAPTSNRQDSRNWESPWTQLVPHETGGIAAAPDFADPTATARAVSEILANERSYYMLGYSSTDPAKIHVVDVKVDRPGFSVMTRRLYRPPPESRAAGGANAPAERGTGLVNVLAGVLPKADLPISVNAVPFTTAATQEAILYVDVAPTKTSSGASGGRIDILADLFTRDGSPRGTATAVLRPAATGPQGTDARVALLTFPVPRPGLYEVRVAAHDEKTLRDGSVYLSVEVPNFANDTVSLSGVLVNLAAAPARSSSSVEVTLPVLPTTVRTFSRSTDVRALVRVYEGGSRETTPVSVVVEVVDAQDRSLAREAYQVGAERFASSRSVDIAYALPTDKLPPGEYLLVFSTSLGKATATREVRFRMQ